MTLGSGTTGDEKAARPESLSWNDFDENTV